MRKVFVYEAICAGAHFSGETNANERWDGGTCELLPEGYAMLAALCEDLSRIEGVEAYTMLSRHLDGLVPQPQATVGWLDRSTTKWQREKRFMQLAAKCDYSIVVAPESAGELDRVATLVVTAGGTLLGPSLPTIKLGADKQLFAECCVAAGLRIPKGVVLRADEAPESIVGKLTLRSNSELLIRPLDGVGCESVRRFDSLEAFLGEPPFPSAIRVEEFCRGQATSVAFLRASSGDSLVLQPCLQDIRFDTDGNASYFGGTVLGTDAPQDWIARCQCLGRRVADLVDGGTGYHGVDLLLGDATDGADDVVLELNPRMTTSYVGLRHATSTNIAELMLVLAERGNCPSSNLSWERESMAFQVDKLPG